MSNSFLHNRVIIIFSPQPWQNLYISKHHYARVLASNNKVFFITSPNSDKSFSWEIFKPEVNIDLNVVKFGTPLPRKLRFYMPWLYKSILRRYLRILTEKISPTIDVCIDFGCYQMFWDLKFVNASVKIFFPVDDHVLLEPNDRGSQLILSVSGNIVEKFRRTGKSCHFINHGLSHEFAEVARKTILHLTNYNKAKLTRIAYAGNLFIEFLDIPVFQRLIERNPEVQFHLFGSMKYDPKIRKFKEWDNFLDQSPNVILHGLVAPSVLAVQYAEMDGFLLCYLPDYKNYHAENSHKVFEYLSTGKMIVSSHMSLYEGNPLIRMTPKDRNDLLPVIFEEAVRELENLNSARLMKQRMELALDNTYEKQVERINNIIGRTVKGNAEPEKNQFHNQPASGIGERGMGRY